MLEITVKNRSLNNQINAALFCPKEIDMKKQNQFSKNRKMNIDYVRKV